MTRAVTPPTRRYIAVLISFILTLGAIAHVISICLFITQRQGVDFAFFTGSILWFVFYLWSRSPRRKTSLEIHREAA